MATIKREISQKINGNGKSEIILRLTIGRGLQPRLKSGLFINPGRFNNGTIIKPRANQKEATELRALETELTELEQFLLNYCTNCNREELNKGIIIEALAQYKNPEKYKPKNEKKGFFERFNEFIAGRNLSEWRIKHYRVLERALKRFEAYQRATTDQNYKLELESLNVNDLNAFESFLRNEPEIASKFPDIYLANPADTRKARKVKKPLPKGDNTIVCTFGRLRAFINWCNEQGIISQRPFEKYTGVTTEKYGTPYYISIEERDIIADFDLSEFPDLEAQRDIFIFQCLIGCRVSDLMRLTQANIISEGVEYIPSKTKGDRAEVIRVPLHHRATSIIKKYEGRPDGKLLPFISPQRYNDSIKRIFQKCGITRNVIVLNPTTGKEESRPLNEIASSHIARRTFVGNLYKKVKDPNLVGKLSGHKEGSRAFARYRDIDEDMKRDLINLLGD